MRRCSMEKQDQASEHKVASVGLAWAAETGPQGLAQPGRPGRRGAPRCVLGFERPWIL